MAVYLPHVGRGAVTVFHMPDRSVDRLPKLPPVPPSQRVALMESERLSRKTDRLVKRRWDHSDDDVLSTCTQYVGGLCRKGSEWPVSVDEDHWCVFEDCVVKNIGEYVNVCMASGHVHACGPGRCNAAVASDRGEHVCPLTGMVVGSAMIPSFEAAGAAWVANRSAERAAKEAVKREAHAELMRKDECNTRTRLFYNHVMSRLPRQDVSMVEACLRRVRKLKPGVHLGYLLPRLGSLTRHSVACYVATICETLWHLVDAKRPSVYTAELHVVVVLHYMQIGGHVNFRGTFVVPDEKFFEFVFGSRAAIMSPGMVSGDVTSAAATFSRMVEYLGGLTIDPECVAPGNGLFDASFIV